ncbi:unnamed protein product [marine sediment metagenome]|uniref:Uncharacterized protein n=1 Tax=marine sediment metagenome TaxID=412755 RepID=X1GHR7_9ZZZZ
MDRKRDPPEWIVGHSCEERACHKGVPRRHDYRGYDQEQTACAEEDNYTEVMKEGRQ